jgi:hypothetical protein
MFRRNGPSWSLSVAVDWTIKIDGMYASLTLSLYLFLFSSISSSLLCVCYIIKFILPTLIVKCPPLN